MGVPLLFRHSALFVGVENHERTNELSSYYCCRILGSAYELVRYSLENQGVII